MASTSFRKLDSFPESEGQLDPLQVQPSNFVRDGDFVILHFSDGRKFFAQCLKHAKGKAPPVKINKRSYPTANLVGLPYGTVLELGSSKLIPLSDEEGVIPKYPEIKALEDAEMDECEDEEVNVKDSTFPSISQANDNRNLVDDNKAQALSQSQVQRLRRTGTEGSAIVETLIENSATFKDKTEFSKAKYVTRKQMKYQQRCRIVRCTPYSICQAMFLKDPRRMLNMREDTLGQILSYSNVCAGCQVLVMETVMGVVTGALAQRMGGYGKVLSVYSGQQPPFYDMISRFNLSFAEHHSIKWIHNEDVFVDDLSNTNDVLGEDSERKDRERLLWPCPLQEHTRAYLETMKDVRAKKDFLAKRCNRFARKLTRHTHMEAKEWLNSRHCDSVIIVTHYDPTATLLELLPYLAPSSPFVVFCEFIEPLAQCFRELQKEGLAINIRLSDTWMREYQVLPGRTHPSMTMSQTGGFILTGIKLCPVTGHNELEESVLKEIKERIGGRRGRKTKGHKDGNDSSQRKKAKIS